MSFGRINGWRDSSTNTTLQVALAILFLVVGTLVYLIVRPPNSAFLIPGIAYDYPSSWRDWLAPLAGPLPTFTHTVAFALLTGALALPGRHGALSACVLWFGIESLFEIGQVHPVAVALSGYLSAWFEHVPVLDHAGSYFLHGTFDYLDLAAAALGAAIAYRILLLGKERMT